MIVPMRMLRRSFQGGTVLPTSALDNMSAACNVSADPLAQAICCMEVVGDRAVWLAAALQVAIFAKVPSFKVRRHIPLP
jgi:hypothetical protein